MVMGTQRSDVAVVDGMSGGDVRRGQASSKPQGRGGPRMNEQCTSGGTSGAGKECVCARRTQSLEPVQQHCHGRRSASETCRHLHRQLPLGCRRPSQAPAARAAGGSRDIGGGLEGVSEGRRRWTCLRNLDMIGGWAKWWQGRAVGVVGRSRGGSPLGRCPTRHRPQSLARH